MKMKVVCGASLAIAAVALAVSGAATSALAKTASPVHCVGVNSCKGMSACKSANNSCKGLNSCKGQGWAPAESAEACAAQGGTVAEM